MSKMISREVPVSRALGVVLDLSHIGISLLFVVVDDFNVDESIRNEG